MSYAVVNPATGESVKTYPTISDADLKAAVDKAAEAHAGWSRSTTVAERAALIQKVADLHTERRQEGKVVHDTATNTRTPTTSTAPASIESA